MIFKFIPAGTFVRAVERGGRLKGEEASILPADGAPQNPTTGYPAAERNVFPRDRYAPRSGSRVDKTMPSMFIKYSIAVAL